MSLAAPTSPASPKFHRSHSDRELIVCERRLSRPRLNSSNSSSNIAFSFVAPPLPSPAIPTPLAAATSPVPPSPLLLPWDRLQKWLYGIAVVTFDLELGQSIELLLPSHCKLTDKERSNLSYLAFPDSNSTFLGDTQYHFRIRHESTLPFYYQHYNTLVPPALQVDSNSLFGYVNFRQVRDKAIKRGYFQKSLVLLSKLPFISLFTSIVSQLGPNYFEYGLESLEACCNLMDRQWPEPEPGKTLLLPLLGNVLQVRIPTHGDKPFSSSDLIQHLSNVSETKISYNSRDSSIKLAVDDDSDVDSSSRNSSAIKQVLLKTGAQHTQSYTSFEFPGRSDPKVPRLIPLVHDVNTFQALSCVLNQIQVLWELVLLNESIAILGSFPTNCTQTVQALVHIIWPLRYATDYRPFFTIHNSEFQEITFNGSKTPSNQSVSKSIMIGVTNPFFAKLLHQWPHMIRIDDNQADRSRIKDSDSFRSTENSYDSDYLKNNREHNDASFSSLPIQKLTNNVKSYKRVRSMLNNSSHLSFDMKPGLYTKYKPYLQRDKNILKKLQPNNAQQRPDTVQNALIRRFFLELTQSFIIPLERYFSSLLPLKKLYQPNRKPPTIKDFDPEEFLKTIDQYGPQLTSGLKGDWKELYRHFLATANFRLWLNQRRQEANTKIYSLYIETIANCRLEQDLNLSRLTEVELIDLLLKFGDFVQRLESKTDELLMSIDPSTKLDYIGKFRAKIKTIINEKLSDDMKSIFNKQLKLSANSG